MTVPDLTAPPDILLLAAFLDSARAPPGAFSLSELDGLLTAAAIGPDTILPSEWLALVWGEEQPVFDSQEEAGAVLAAMMARYNEIVASFQGDPPSYEPLFWHDENDKPIIEDWCYGFMAGVALRPEQWARLMDAPQGVFLLPIMAHVPQFVEDAFDPADLTDFEPERAIPALVANLHNYWLGRRAKKNKRANVVRVSETRLCVKVGRNDPCPCGSGVKFKRCCGATA